MIIHPNHFCYHNFALKSLPGGVPHQALILALRGAGHHPDGPDGLQACSSHQDNYPQELLIIHLGSKINPQVVKVQISSKLYYDNSYGMALVCHRTRHRTRE